MLWIYRVDGLWVNDRFRTLSYVSTLVALVLAGVFFALLLEVFVSRPYLSRVVTVFIAACALGMFWGGYQEPLRGLVRGMPTDIDPWHIFHYDLNARYLDELRYASLYGCALKADELGPQAFLSVQKVRDLETYRIVPREALPPCPQERFSKDRWQQFQSDVVGIEKFLRIPENVEYRSWGGDQKLYWQGIFQDKGYNLSPFAARVTQGALTFFSDNRWSQWEGLFLGEVLLLFLSILAIWYAFSARAAALFALFMTTFWGTYPFLVNMLFQHLWLPLVIFGLAAWKKGKEKTSVIFLALATAMRIFPVVFLLPVGWHILSLLRRTEERRRAISLLICLLIVGALAVWIGGSLTLWRDYLAKIALHRSFLEQELFHIGWPTLVQQVAPRATSVLLPIGMSLLVAGYIYAVRSASAVQRMILAPVIAYAGLSLSPYYYLMLPLLALLQPVFSVRVARLSAMGTLLVFFVHAITGQYGLRSFAANEAAPLWSEVPVLALFIFHLVLMWYAGRKKIDIFAHPT